MDSLVIGLLSISTILTFRLLSLHNNKSNNNCTKESSKLSNQNFQHFFQHTKNLTKNTHNTSIVNFSTIPNIFKVTSSNGFLPYYYPLRQLPKPFFELEKVST